MARRERYCTRRSGSEILTLGSIAPTTSSTISSSTISSSTTKTQTTRKRARFHHYYPPVCGAAKNRYTLSIGRRLVLAVILMTTTLLVVASHFSLESGKRTKMGFLAAAAFRPTSSSSSLAYRSVHGRIAGAHSNRIHDRIRVQHAHAPACNRPRFYHATIRPLPRTITTTSTATTTGATATTGRWFSALSSSTAEADTTTTSSDDGGDDNDEQHSQSQSQLREEYDANWKESPRVNPSITFDTLLVPSTQLTKWITHPELQHRLAKPDNWEFLKHVHPRIKMVQDYTHTHNDDCPSDKHRIRRKDDDDGDCDSSSRPSSDRSANEPHPPGGFKQLLLLPSSVLHENANQTSTGMPSSDQHDADREKHLDEWLAALLASSNADAAVASDKNNDNETVPTIQKGPALTMPIAYHQLSFQYLLRRLLPESAFPPPSAYEQIGHVAHFNLKERHLPYGKLIGEALLASSNTVSSGGGKKSNSNQNRSNNNDNNNKSIQTVVNKVGTVNGNFRTYECQILADVFDAGRGDSTDESSSSSSSSLETTVTEDGVAIRLNVAECYWCTRLSGERQELLRDILRSEPSQNRPLVVADVFCGAGAVCMLLAKKVKDRHKAQQNQKQKQKQSASQNGSKNQSSGGTSPEEPLLKVLANDWNPRAIEYMKQSIAANGMDKEKDGRQSMYHRFELSCRDSYDFLFELGEEQQPKANPYAKKRKLRRRTTKTKTTMPDDLVSGNSKNKEEQQPREQPSLPDHVLMNFPLEAPRFLGALRWWSWKRLEQEHEEKSTGRRPWYPRFHVYTFAWSSEPRAGDEEEMAINLVANELLPPYVFSKDDGESNDDNDGDGENDTAGSVASTTIYRRSELNDEFGTDLSTRLVRDVAPGKVVVCVSFSVTPKLIRYMQGDYS